MSRLLRMAYGHGGTRLGRILVSVPHAESAPLPRWLSLLLLTVWIAVPVLVSLYAVPTATHQKTIIDISHLEVKPPPEPPVIPEPPRTKPAEPPPEPVPAPAQSAQKPLEQPPKEPPRPVITRPSAPRAPVEQEYLPRITRERTQTAMESVAPAAAPIRRQTVASGAPAEKEATITRTRGATAADAPAARERVATLRRAPVAEGPTQRETVTLQPVTRKARSSDLSGPTEGSAQRITRERSQVAAAGNGGTAASAGVARGITLASLAICSTPQAEEDGIRAVLGVVGSRQSCTDEKGEFQFKGTRRISSFNLVIFPAQGRRPSNRCEELENAYRCLKTH